MAESVYHYDVFISHVSEDKEAVARPLAEALQSHDLKVWFDASVIKTGDYFDDKIDEGVLRSRYAVVVFSPAFVEKKQWANSELKAFHKREIESSQVVILPVLHNLTFEKLEENYPRLGSKHCVCTDPADPAVGLDKVVASLLEVLSPDQPEPSAARARPGTPPPRPAGNLLAYLANRREQDRELEKVFSTRTETGATGLPMVCVVHGDHLQSHDMYVERLVHHSLPRHLGLDDRTLFVRDFALNWPERLDTADELGARLLQNLAEVMPQARPADRGATRDELEAMNARLASHRGPVVIHTKFHGGDAGPDWRESLDAYFRFWDEWPRLQPNQDLFVILLVEYGRRRGLDLFNRVEKTNRRLRDYLEAGDRNGFAGCARIAPKVLPQLKNVTKLDADNWARTQVKQHHLDRFPKVLTRITEIFEDVRELPMDELVAKLEPALLG